MRVLPIVTENSQVYWGFCASHAGLILVLSLSNIIVLAGCNGRSNKEDKSSNIDPQFVVDAANDLLSVDGARDALVKMLKETPDPGLFGYINEKEIDLISVKRISDEVVEFGVYECNLKAKTFSWKGRSFEISGRFVRGNEANWVAEVIVFAHWHKAP